MESSYLIDTNVIIDLLADRLPPAGRDFIERVLDKNKVVTSVINRIELLSFTGPENELTVLEDFLNNIPVLPLSESVILKTITVRRHRRIKLPDAVIAATALDRGLTLLSRNTRDFRRVSSLEHLDPYEL
jgi:predicted nucleic acid-binding protein